MTLWKKKKKNKKTKQNQEQQQNNNTTTKMERFWNLVPALRSCQKLTH